MIKLYTSPIPPSFVSNEKPYVEVDLSGYNTPIIRVPTQEHFIGQLVTTLRYFFGKGEDTFADHFLQKLMKAIFLSKDLFFMDPLAQVKLKQLLKQVAG